MIDLVGPGEVVMVRFVELAKASEEMIDGVVENVDRSTLAMALQGANARLIERVLGSRSSEEIGEVLTHIQAQQAASVAQIENARRQVAEIAAELEAAGIPVRD